MFFNKVLIFVIGLTLALKAQAVDAELTNYHTGIDVVWGGTKKTAYMEEYFYSDKMACDRKVVYIRDDTTITMSHNSRNVAYLNSGYTIIGTGGSFDGVIRFRIDRDFQWRYNFANDGADNLPAYSVPFTLSSQTFSIGVPVVGTTGDNGVTLNNANRASYIYYGILDSFHDQWHVLTIADDDTTNPSISPNTEFQASDGKVILLVVNPVTPAMTIRITGNGQFYTTPPKAYFVPRVVPQTTYFNAGTGSVTFEIHDLYNTNSHYRINGGSWSGGSTTINLSDTDFSVGSNTLDYYDDGFGSTSNYKTRTVIKNPVFPSAGESHGTLFFGAGGWPAALARINQSGNPVGNWLTTFNTQTFFNNRPFIEANFDTGNRINFSDYGYGDAAMHTACAKVYGWDTVALSSTKTYGWLAKVQVIDNCTNIDSVGLEKDQSGTSLGTRETIYRGYYDVNALNDLIIAYDLMISEYKDSQFTGGITAIEDYFVRGCIARAINEQIFNNNLGVTAGMWPTARDCFALAAMYDIPTYSDAVFGTNGLDGNTTTYLLNPFPAAQYTWKQILIDNNQTLTSFPNYNRRLGVEEYMFDSSGNFLDRVSYVGYPIMGHALIVGVMMAKLHSPTVLWPNFDLGMVNCANGTIIGTPNEGPAQYNQASSYNTMFPSSANLGLNWSASQSDVSDERFSRIMLYSSSPGLYWTEYWPFRFQSKRKATSTVQTIEPGPQI